MSITCNTLTVIYFDKSNCFQDDKEQPRSGHPHGTRLTCLGEELLISCEIFINMISNIRKKDMCWPRRVSERFCNLYGRALFCTSEINTSDDFAY